MKQKLRKLSVNCRPETEKSEHSQFEYRIKVWNKARVLCIDSARQKDDANLKYSQHGLDHTSRLLSLNQTPTGDPHSSLMCHLPETGGSTALQVNSKLQLRSDVNTSGLSNRASKHWIQTLSIC